LSNRVLLTGARGFIGRHCLEPLVAGGWEIHAVGRGEPPASAPGCHWHGADLHDHARLAGLVGGVSPTHLLHLAWHAGPDVYSAPENVAWIDTSLRLLEAFRDAGGRRAVLAGSCAEYDWSPPSGSSSLSEKTTPCRPASAYGEAKHALRLRSEALLREAGMSGAWARVFFVYGPGEHPGRLVSSVVRSLLAGEEALCTHGEQLRDYLYVGDVADALVRLLASDVEGPINVASGRPVALRELVERAARLLGGEALVRLGALPARPGEPAALVADVGRLAGELGWKPATPLDEGLARTVEWWRRNPHADSGAAEAATAGGGGE